MIITFNFLFRALTVIIFFLWWAYWIISAEEADRQKPKTSYNAVSDKIIRRWLMRVIEIVMILQILGLQLFPISGKPFLPQVIGFMLIVIGVSISVSARKALGANWTHAYEYQIKKEHALITEGIYAYIRHPIYTGLYIAFIGGELVAQSFVALLFVLLFVGGYWQARQEEVILLKHFGGAYKSYMKQTKMFIPYIW
jgi:protein-S-isoprenylcysteine O-methyltransferase Ste14